MYLNKGTCGIVGSDSAVAKPDEDIPTSLSVTSSNKAYSLASQLALNESSLEPVPAAVNSRVKVPVVPLDITVLFVPSPLILRELQLETS